MTTMREKYEQLTGELKAWNKTRLASWELIDIIKWLADRIIEEKSAVSGLVAEVTKGRKEVGLAKAREAKQKKRADELAVQVKQFGDDNERCDNE